MPALTPSQREAGRAAVEFSEARVLRRELETDLFAGEYRDARSRYVAARRAFPNRPKYLLGLGVITLSPRLYASIKARNMV
jgi:hypothetical protein